MADELPTVRAAIFNAAGEVLLVRHAYDQKLWAMPGGAMDEGESPVDAVVREVGEETGLEVKVEGLFGVYWVRNPDNLTLAFRCRVTGGRLRANPGEILEARYFPTDALPRPITRGTLLRVADGRRDGLAVVRTLERVKYLR
ncbi:MAG: NUDIX domain-containing protein [Armatimonadetes bacterium]|nr:NUDIX domain-containing protein [Armatimonadota bacterium]